jgi:hypothetical protein
VTRYLSLAEYVWLAEQVTGVEAAVLAKDSRLDLADSALHAPAAGFEDQDFYPDESTLEAAGRDSSIPTSECALLPGPTPGAYTLRSQSSLPQAVRLEWPVL